MLAGDDAIARGRQASAALSERLDALLEAAGVAPSELEVVACGVGPGMFTGVRVALATAKGIAMGLGVPGIGVSTMAAVAASIPGNGLRLALLDARRGEVYAGLYRCGETSVTPVRADACAPLSTVLDQLEEPALVVGPGVVPYADLLAAHPQVEGSVPLEGPDGAGLWRATTGAWDTRTNAAELAAVYLRKSYAELGIHQPKRPFVKSPFVD